MMRRCAFDLCIFLNCSLYVAAVAVLCVSYSLLDFPRRASGEKWVSVRLQCIFCNHPMACKLIFRLACGVLSPFTVTSMVRVLLSRSWFGCSHVSNARTYINTDVHDDILVAKIPPASNSRDGIYIPNLNLIRFYSLFSL